MTTAILIGINVNCICIITIDSPAETWTTLRLLYHFYQTVQMVVISQRNVTCTGYSAE